MSLDTARRVLKIEAQAIQDVLARLDTRFEKAVDLLFACKGRVVLTGIHSAALVPFEVSPMRRKELAIFNVRRSCHESW